MNTQRHGSTTAAAVVSAGQMFSVVLSWDEKGTRISLSKTKRKNRAEK